MNTTQYFYTEANKALQMGYPRVAEAYVEELRQKALVNRQAVGASGQDEYKAIARIYHQIGISRVQERFDEITRIQDEIRATWTEAQRLDFTFHDHQFDALSGESFYLMTGGRDTLSLSIEQVAEMADEVVTL
jgi:hypothetical protein